MNFSNAFQIGWSEVDITPDKKVSLRGQFAERISEYVEKPITVTAMCVKTADEMFIICACELVSITGDLMEEVRAKIAEKTDKIDTTKVMVSATHIHTGPGYDKSNVRSSGFRIQLEAVMPKDRKYIEAANLSDNPEIASPREMFDFLSERIATAAVTAYNNAAPAAFFNAFGRAPIGQCRRAVFTDGSAQMWGDTNTAMFDKIENGNDSGIELLYTFNAENKLTGIVANIACPAQCVQHRLFVSPDYWGEARMLLKKQFGDDIFLLPLCSAAGDQCPVDLVRWVEPYSDVNDPNITRKNPLPRKADPSMFDIEGMKLDGRRVAREIIAVYEDNCEAGYELQAPDTIVHNVCDFKLPLRRVTMKDIAAAHAGINEFFREHPGDVNYNDAAVLQIHFGTLGRAKLQEKQDIVNTEVHIIRLGSIAIATNPFELFLNYGNQIRARSFAEQTFLIQLCCNAYGYLPTEDAEKGSHYSAFVSSGRVGHIGGEQLVRETLTEINNLF